VKQITRQFSCRFCEKTFETHGRQKGHEKRDHSSQIQAQRKSKRVCGVVKAGWYVSVSPKKKQITVGAANKCIQSGKETNATTAASNTRGGCLEITQGKIMHSKHDGKRDGAESKADDTSTDDGRDSGKTYHKATIKRGRNMTNDNNNACVICGEKIGSSQSLYEHYNKAHRTLYSPNVNNSEFVCILCNRRLKTGKTLREHILYIHFSRYICETCGQYFGRKVTLKNHTAKKHP